MAPKTNRSSDAPKEVTLVNADGYEISISDPTSLHNHLGAGFRVKSGTTAEAETMLSEQAAEQTTSQ
jgi:hypothetical protein